MGRKTGDEVSDVLRTRRLTAGHCLRGAGAQKSGQDLGCFYWVVSTEEAIEATAVNEIPRRKCVRDRLQPRIEPRGPQISPCRWHVCKVLQGERVVGREPQRREGNSQKRNHPC